MYLRLNNSQPLVTNTVDFINSTKLDEKKDIFNDSLLVRLGYQFPLARAIKIYDNDKLEYKTDYLDNIIALVPRVLWPEKPVIGINSNDMGHDLDLVHPTDRVTSIGVTPVGEAFYELGYLGIFIVPIFLAFLLYLFTQILNEGSWLGFLLSIILGLLLGMSDWYSSLIPALLKTFIIFYFFGLLLNKKYTDGLKLKLRW